MQQKVYDFVHSGKVQGLVTLTIILNSIILGLETDADIMDFMGSLLVLLDHFCLFVFTVELVLKIFAERVEFVKSGWNVFDFFIVAISFMPSSGAFSVFRVFRVFRAFRTLKIIEHIRSLRIIIAAIFGALPSIGWVSVLLLIIFYIFSIIGTTIFGPEFPEWFGSIPKTMYTLFQVMTLESWSMGISRPVMEVFPHAYLYFIPFILMTAFLVLNVVIGMVTNSIGEISEQVDAEFRAAALEKMKLRSEFETLKKQIELVESLLNDN